MAGLGEALFTALSHKPENAVDLFLHLRLQSTLRDPSSLIKKKKKYPGRLLCRSVGGMLV